MRWIVRDFGVFIYGCIFACKYVFLRRGACLPKKQDDTHNPGFTLFWFPRDTDLCAASERRTLARQKAMEYERTRAGV